MRYSSDNSDTMLRTNVYSLFYVCENIKQYTAIVVILAHLFSHMTCADWGFGAKCILRNWELYSWSRNPTPLTVM
jgi:hypothetical protein